MIYDLDLSKSILFGGNVSVSKFNDTWSFDGMTWQKENPSTSPLARSEASMAYFAPSKKIVLFGGNGTSIQLGDTWLYNG